MTSPRSLPYMILAGLTVMAATAVAQVYWNGLSELETGNRLIAQQRPEEALEHLERAILWHLPFGATAEDAAGRLFDLATQWEQDHRREDALNACRRLRAAFYAARSVTTPGLGWIRRCDEKMADWMAESPALSPGDAAKSKAQRRAEFLELLTAERPPHNGWALAAEAGFLGWVGCLFAGIFRACTPQGEWSLRPALAWGAGWAACFLLWLFALYRV